MQIIFWWTDRDRARYIFSTLAICRLGAAACMQAIVKAVAPAEGGVTAALQASLRLVETWIKVLTPALFRCFELQKCSVSDMSFIPPKGTSHCNRLHC